MKGNMKEEFVEECWFIYGVRIKRYFFGVPVYQGAGSSGHVEFDWAKAMHPLLLGWIHTHPEGFGAYPSETDNSTMAGWVRGKARPLICGIICRETQDQSCEELSEEDWPCGEEQCWFDYYRDFNGGISRRVLTVGYTPNFVWGKIHG